MWHVWVTGRVLTGFWWGNLRERDHLEVFVLWEDNIKNGSLRCRMGIWIGLM